MFFGKTLISNFWSVGKSVVNKFIKGFIDGSCTKKKILFHSVSNFLGTIWHNIDKRNIYNSISELTVTVTFADFLFQLSGIYQRTDFIDELTVVLTFAVILFQFFGIYQHNKSVGNFVRHNLKIFFKNNLLNINRK
jgi:hypothetical protein